MEGILDRSSTLLISTNNESVRTKLNRYKNQSEMIDFFVCENSDIDVIDHFTDINKMVQIGSGAYREQIDYKLTRYACYLIAQNSRGIITVLNQDY